MTDPFHDAVAVLCEEVGLNTPSPKANGGYEFDIDSTILKAFPLNNGRLILTGAIGKIVQIAEARRESARDLLASCLTLHGARFRKLGLQETMTIEPEQDELILWRKFDHQAPGISDFLQAVESLLNEVRFWKRWLLSI